MVIPSSEMPCCPCKLTDITLLLYLVPDADAKRKELCGPFFCMHCQSHWQRMQTACLPIPSCAREHLQGKWHAPFSRVRRASNVEGDAVIDEKGQTYTSHVEKLLFHVSRLMQSSGVDNTYHAPNAASSDRPGRVFSNVRGDDG